MASERELSEMKPVPGDSGGRQLASYLALDSYCFDGRLLERRGGGSGSKANAF